MEYTNYSLEYIDDERKLRELCRLTSEDPISEKDIYNIVISGNFDFIDNFKEVVSNDMLTSFNISSKYISGSVRSFIELIEKPFTSAVVLVIADILSKRYPKLFSKHSVYDEEELKIISVKKCIELWDVKVVESEISTYQYVPSKHMIHTFKLKLPNKYAVDMLLKLNKHGYNNTYKLGSGLGTVTLIVRCTEYTWRKLLIDASMPLHARDNMYYIYQNIYDILHKATDSRIDLDCFN